MIVGPVTNHKFLLMLYIAHRELIEIKMLETVSQIDKSKADELDKRVKLKKYLESEARKVLISGYEAYCFEQRVSPVLLFFIVLT